MRAVFGLVLLIGIGLAGFAVMQVKGFLDSKDAQLTRQQQLAAQAVKTVEVYAPIRALTYGEFVTAEDVHLIQYAEDFLPEGVFSSEEELFPQGLDEPRVVSRPMEVNEPILASKVTAPGAPLGLTALLKPGTRAYPLSTNMTSEYEGQLRPGTKVDIFWIGRIGDKTETRLLMPRLEVLAIDVNSRVVLQVSTEDFAALSQAQTDGQLKIAPVGDTDDTTAPEISIGTNDVLGIQAPAAPAPVVQEQRCYVGQGFGANRVEVEVECD